MMQIIKLSADDYEDWLQLWRGYLEFYRADISTDTTNNTFAKLTDGSRPMGGFMARDAGKAVGIVHWIKHLSCWTDGDYCYLQDLFVDDNQRAKGTGRALVAAVTAAATAQKCARVYWLTQEKNVQAIELYNKLAIRSGFIQFVQKLG